MSSNVPSRNHHPLGRLNQPIHISKPARISPPWISYRLRPHLRPRWLLRRNQTWKRPTSPPPAASSPRPPSPHLHPTIARSIKIPSHHPRNAADPRKQTWQLDKQLSPRHPPHQPTPPRPPAVSRLPLCPSGRVQGDEVQRERPRRGRTMRSRPPPKKKKSNQSQKVQSLSNRPHFPPPLRRPVGNEVVLLARRTRRER